MSQFDKIRPSERLENWWKEVKNITYDDGKYGNGDSPYWIIESIKELEIPPIYTNAFIENMIKENEQLRSENDTLKYKDG